MKNSRRLPGIDLNRLLLVVTTTILLIGCQSLPASYSGSTVPEARRIQLAGSGEQSGHYVTEDLKIDFKYVRNQSNLNISGSIVFADRLRFNFARIDNFHADLMFVDDQGKVLSTQGINTSASSESEYPLDFGAKLVVPSGAVAMAFSYSGRATSGSPRDRRDRESMEFWDHPLQK